MDIWGILSLIGISSIISAIVAGILGAFYGPAISDYLKRRQLRQTLYRELNYIYEDVTFQIGAFNEFSKERFFSPLTFESELERPVVGNSILQSQTNPQIWRGALKGILGYLRKILFDIELNLIDNNLYKKTLTNKDDLKLFYQLHDGNDIATTYENFIWPFDLKFPSWKYIPSSPFLTQEEARELSLLENQFDFLKIACKAFDRNEESGGLDKKLLNKMRCGKEKGTSKWPTGKVSKAHRWCDTCQRYVVPAKRYRFCWFLPLASLYNALTLERCSNCSSKLKSFVDIFERYRDELSKDEKLEVRLTAAKSLGELYKFCKGPSGIEPLIKALRDDKEEVRAQAAESLGKIGNEKAAESLIKVLEHRENCGLRESAVYALGRMGKTAIKPLTKILNDEFDDENIRGAAATVLGEIGDRTVLLHLSRAVQDTSSASLRQAAEKALALIMY